MLKSRKNSENKTTKRIEEKHKDKESTQGFKITGWNSQEHDYFSYGISNYLRPNNTRGLSFTMQGGTNPKPRKVNYNDENKYNTKRKGKYQQHSSNKNKGQSQSKLSYHLLSQNQSKELKTPKQHSKQTKRQSSCRMSNITQRMMLRKQYPKGVFQFKQTRKQLQQINKNISQISQRNSNVIIEDNKCMNVLPRIRPFLNSNKLLKLQMINQKKLSPIKSSRLSKHNSSQFNQPVHYQFDDQKIYCLSVQCLDD